MKNLLPAFFIIGERKCGTSSLYRYLVAHNQVLPCKMKEPDFFSKPLWRMIGGFGKYKSLFPVMDNEGNLEFLWPELDETGQLYTETITVEQQKGVRYITGEASVNTFYYANPRYVKWFLPNVKIILMLREPAERAFSHYRMQERFKKEGRKTMPLTNFTDDIRKEMEKVNQGKESLLLSPSIYARQLPKWLKVFGRKNLFIIKSEDLYDSEKAKSIMGDLFEYLDLPDFDVTAVMEKKFNVAPPKEMPIEIKEELQAFFTPFNRELEEMLGKAYY